MDCHERYDIHVCLRRKCNYSIINRVSRDWVNLSIVHQHICKLWRLAALLNLSYVSLNWIIWASGQIKHENMKVNRMIINHMSCLLQSYSVTVLGKQNKERNFDLKCVLVHMFAVRLKRSHVILFTSHRSNYCVSVLELHIGPSVIWIYIVVITVLNISMFLSC